MNRPQNYWFSEWTSMDQFSCTSFGSVLCRTSSNHVSISDRDSNCECEVPTQFMFLNQVRRWTLAPVIVNEAGQEFQYKTFICLHPTFSISNQPVRSEFTHARHKRFSYLSLPSHFLKSFEQHFPFLAPQSSSHVRARDTAALSPYLTSPKLVLNRTRDLTSTVLSSSGMKSRASSRNIGPLIMEVS